MPRVPITARRTGTGARRRTTEFFDEAPILNMTTKQVILALDWVWTTVEPEAPPPRRRRRRR